MFFAVRHHLKKKKKKKRKQNKRNIPANLVLSLLVLQSVAKACPDPKPTYFIRCTFWSTALSLADVKNTGSTLEEFKILIAGSNGYNLA